MDETIAMTHDPVRSDRVAMTAESPRALGELELSIYQQSEQDRIWPVWRELEQRLGDVPITCSSEWTRIWLKHYSEQVRPWFVLASTDGIPRGICLLSESTNQKLGPFRIHSLHLGTAGEPHGHSVCVEYNDLLVEPEFRAVFTRKLGLLIASERGWDQFQLDGIPCTAEDSWPLLADDGHAAAGPGAKPLATNVRIRDSRYFDLEQCRQEGGDILAQLGKSTRANIRRRLRQVEETSVEWAETVAQGESIFNELIEMHQARWQAVGMPGAFASSSFLNFQKDLIAELLPQQRVVLARIRSGDITVGCLYLLVDRNRLLDYVSGLAPFEEFPSPGLISHYLCMEEALHRGFDAYDFLVGEKRHKENLGKASEQLQWIVFERPRTKFSLRNWARHSKQLVKRVWKRS